MNDDDKKKNMTKNADPNVSICVVQHSYCGCMRIVG